MSDQTPSHPPRAPRRQLALTAVCVGSLLLALYLWTERQDGAVQDADPEAVATAGGPASAPAPEAPAAPVADSAGEPLPPEPAPVALAAAPGFDLVRIAPDGAAVVAGRAAPGAAVTIYADAAPLAEVEADSEGNFVAIFRAEPSVSPQELTLGAALPGEDEVLSGDVVMLLPDSPPAELSGPAEAEPAEAAPEATPEPDPVATAAVAAEATAESEPPATAASETSEDADAAVPPVDAAAHAGAEVATEVAPEAAAAGDAPAPGGEAGVIAETGEAAQGPRVAATAIVRADGLEVTTTEALQPRQVSLASISYADDGEVMLAGLGTAGARLRAYVDDGFAQEATVGVDGRWSLELGDVEAGIYRLRIDQIDGSGRVASRVETPFQRDLPQPPPPRPFAGDRPVQVTVQPGSNLWTLARVHYGSGVLYSQIFLANKDLIRDPHLIYPGQIFNLPGAEENR